MKSPLTWQRIQFYIPAYLLWLVNMVVCAAALLEFRSAVNTVWLMTGSDFGALGVVNQVILLLGGLVALIYVAFLESYYRRCVPQVSALLRRVAWTTAIPVGVLLASRLASYLASSFSH